MIDSSAIDRNRSVCFTGHRGVAKNDMSHVMSMLYSRVSSLVNKGFDTFITGGAVGFDTMAAECVAQLKERFGGITHILALPCRDQTAKWKSLDDLSRYKRLLGGADAVEYISDFYTPTCMHERNRWMVDNSSYCIAYMTGIRGGTAYTCRYAESLGITVENLAPDAQLSMFLI